MTLKQALKQLADIEATLAALEADLTNVNDYRRRTAEVRLPAIRAAAAEGRAWIKATYPETTI